MSISRKHAVWPVPVALAAAALATAVLLGACKPGDPARSTGAYPIDIFQEMHYNQSLKAQEPPRLLPPEGSYPVAGGFIPVGNKAESKELISPFAADGDTLARGALLFRQNCSFCHGLTAGGDGYVGQKFADNGAPRPPAFSDARVRGLTPGEAYSSISRGFGFMPPFQGLLSEEDRWALVALVKASAEDRTASLEAINGLPEPERTLRLLELREATAR